jgi:hypothetical protein
MTDPTLSHHFSHAPKATLIAQQVQLFSYLLGRPASQADAGCFFDMHQPGNLTHGAYERVVTLLRQTLLSANLEGPDIIAVIKLLDEHKDRMAA